MTEEIKSLYKDDNSIKSLSVNFPALSLMLTDKIEDESLELVESIQSDKNLVFGACIASKIGYKVRGVSEDLSGIEFTATHSVNGNPTQLGIYKVDSCPKTDGKNIKVITAYDRMKKIDVDVASWYNGLFPTGSETYTLAAFRASVLSYLGLNEVTRTLPNDSMIVGKTIEPTQISGRTVLEACEEINGAFGHINSSGQFCHIVLKPAYGLYPSDSLYPSDTLYPVSETDTTYTIGEDETITKSIYRENGVKFEEYTVNEIDKLIIRQEENDVGAIAGTGTNAYIIQGNFLVYGKSAADLQTIANNAFGNINKRPYRPYQSENMGLPYIEIGSKLKFETDDTVTGYVLSRTLIGIQSLKDAYTAEGTQELEPNFNNNNEIIQLQGKMMTIKKSVDGLETTVSDLAADTKSQFTQTTENINAEVTRAKGKENELSGSVGVLAGQVVLKVTAAGKIATAELDADPATGTVIKLSADNIVQEGLITANSNFKILADGSIEAVNGKFSGTLVAASGTFTGALSGATGSFSGAITGGSISIGTGFSVSPTGVLTCTGATITGNIVGSTITGSTFNRTENWSGTDVTLCTIDSNGFYSYVGGAYKFQIGQVFNYGYMYSDGGNIYLGSWQLGKYVQINQNGVFINGSTPITSSNIGSQSVNYATSAGGLSSTLYTSQIYASNTGYGNIDFQGFDNAAGVDWVQTNFEPKSSSDVRLKYDIKTFDNIPDDLFYALKPKQFRYKKNSLKTGICFGLIAQEVETAFKSYGLNPNDYNIIEIKDVRSYTDDGFNLKGESHMINYSNLFGWMIRIIQKQCQRITDLENKLNNN